MAAFTADHRLPSGTGTGYHSAAQERALWHDLPLSGFRPVGHQLKRGTYVELGQEATQEDAEAQAQEVWQANEKAAMIDTPFGQQFIVDGHLHFLSRVFVTQLGSAAGIRNEPAKHVCNKLKWQLPPEDPVDLGRQWLQELDEHGVDRAVLLHTLPGDVASVAEAMATRPSRFAAYVMINPDESTAVENLKKAVDEQAFCGVTLFPAMHGFDLTSEAVWKVFELANEKHLTVFVHCGMLKVGFRKALGIRSTFDITQSNPLHLQRAAAEFSNVRWIIPHLGSGMLRELLMLADSCPNVYTDTSGIDGWARYVTGPGGSVSPEDCLKHVLDVLGPERILFGSDSSFFPRGWRRDVFDRQITIFQRLGLAAEQVQMILGSNLTKILRDAERSRPNGN
jgi:predicted TIM-barrel fold metal-dependent hydrolase